MRKRKAVHRVARGVSIATIAAVLWMLVSIPTGFPASELVIFAGPGIVLAIAMSWTANSLRREEWTWTHASRAAAVGAVVYPPIVAFVTAWGGTISPGAMVALFVLTSWCVLGAGLVGAVVRWTLERDDDVAPEAKPARSRARRPRLDLVRE